ncbi:MAG: hypothetical protein AAB401_25225, partial [Acidobacteriota bacterium]
IEHYRRRQMEPLELLTLDEHVSNCAQCRQQLRAALSMESSASLLKAYVPTWQTDEEHLSKNQMRFFLTGKLDAVDKELTESHLEFCDACQSGLNELRLAMRQQQVQVAPNLLDKLADWFRNNLLAIPVTFRFAGAIALLALLVWASALGFKLWTKSPEKTQMIAGTTPSPSPTEDSIPPNPPQLKPSFEFALKDGGRPVTFSADGTLTGFESLTAIEQQSIKDALIAGRVEVSPSLSELKSGSGSLMGGPNNDPAQVWAASSKATLRSPFAEVVAENRPTFRWGALAGAESYVVTINDPSANFREIAVSPKLNTTRWTSPALPQGRLYNWQVTAKMGKDAGGADRQITAPAPEAQEAVFRVLSKSQAEELARGKAAYAGQRLPLGLLYARLGLMKDAEREFQALADENPDAPIARKLLLDLRRQR